MSTAVGDPVLRSLVDGQIESWRAGGEPDAAGFLSAHPELAGFESLVLDLAQEEYCLRKKAGERLVKQQFCDRFSEHRRSVEKMFEVEQFLDQCPQFALANQHVPWPTPGRKFLGYEVVKELGSGTFACVFFAREPDLGRRPVVIKVSKYGMYEAGTLGKLSHPNIMPIHSVQYDLETGWTAICMPLLGTATAVDLLEAAFADGRPKDGAVIARVAATRRPIEDVAPQIDAMESRGWHRPYGDAIALLGRQLAEGLQQAHAAGIRHHDIKPSNVLLGWSGRPMLLDFNLALDDLAVVNRPGGTQEYLAPELVAHWCNRTKRAALRLDPRCDIYSLGAVLYQLLVNELPAPAGPSQSGRDESKQPRRSLRSIDPAIDPRLEAIVQKCLAVDADQRYATAGELAEDLGRYLSFPAVGRRFVGRHRRMFLAAGIGLTLAASGSAAYVASLKPYHERLLDQGLAAYDRGEHERALATFDLCIDRQRDWPEARFARGQTLRRLKRWSDARLDFATLKDVHPGWMNALVGFCHMASKKDDVAASAAYAKAYAAGVRHLPFLLNHADVSRRRSRYYEAMGIYTEIIERHPDCALARRGRAYCHLWYANRQNQNRKRDLVQPDAQAFEDCREDIRLSGGSREAYIIAAQIFGYAVKCNPALDELSTNGSGYLELALERGLTQSSLKVAMPFLRSLVTAKIEDLAGKAPAGNVAAPFEALPQQELPFCPRWAEFLKAVGE